MASESISSGSRRSSKSSATATAVRLRGLEQVPLDRALEDADLDDCLYADDDGDRQRDEQRESGSQRE